jgi:hypothetical protein
MKTFEEVMLLTSTVSSPTALLDEEAKALYDCCMDIGPLGLVVEIGCQLGRSSSLIAQVGAEQCYTHVHVDPYIDNPEYLSQWLDVMQKTNHPFIFYYMKSSRAASHIRNGISLLFIDGDHDYDGVLSDLVHYGWKIERGGYLIMHDYQRESLPDVTRAADEYINKEVIPFPESKWEPIGVFGTLGVWRRK